MSSASSSFKAALAALPAEESVTAFLNCAAKTLPSSSNNDRVLTKTAADVYTKVAAAMYLAATPASFSTASATAYTSGAASAAALKQRQRLLARRHLNLTRRMQPRMSTLEAKMVMCSFNARVWGTSLEERRLADEAVFWEESMAGTQQQ